MRLLVIEVQGLTLQQASGAVNHVFSWPCGVPLAAHGCASPGVVLAIEIEKTIQGTLATGQNLLTAVEGQMSVDGEHSRVENMAYV